MARRGGKEGIWAVDSSVEKGAVNKVDKNFPFRELMLWNGVQSGKKKEINGHIL